jgi:hypothetical protein
LDERLVLRQARAFEQATVAGEVENFGIRVELAHPGGEFIALHPRHQDVDEEQVERLLLLLLDETEDAGCNRVPCPSGRGYSAWSRDSVGDISGTLIRSVDGPERFQSDVVQIGFGR